MTGRRKGWCGSVGFYRWRRDRRKTKEDGFWNEGQVVRKRERHNKDNGKMVDEELRCNVREEGRREEHE